jgi:hypothetical protein
MCACVREAEKPPRREAEENNKKKEEEYCAHTHFLTCSKNVHGEQAFIVYLRYIDHVLFRNTNPCLLQPALRETVGWLFKENEQAVWILWDRSVKPLPHERTPAKESGLVLLKSDIVEMRKLPLQDFLNWILCRSSALNYNRRVGASSAKRKTRP